MLFPETKTYEKSSACAPNHHQTTMTTTFRDPLSTAKRQCGCSLRENVLDGAHPQDTGDEDGLLPKINVPKMVPDVLERPLGKSDEC